MKKLNLLKTIVDFFWINLSLSYFAFIILTIILMSTSNDSSDFFYLFKIQGNTLKKFELEEKILILIITLTTGVLLFSFYKFRKLISNFTKLKIFTDDNINMLNNIGILLIICSFFYAIPISIYEFKNKNINIELGFSSFFTIFILGLFFMILSEIFKISKIQKEENDLTV